MYTTTSNNFKDAVTAPLAVVDFMTDWCQPCKPITKLLQKLEKEYPSVRFVQINAERCQNISSSLGVQSVPTVLFFVNGQADLNHGLDGKRLTEENIRKYLDYRLKAKK